MPQAPNDEPGAPPSSAPEIHPDILSANAEILAAGIRPPRSRDVQLVRAYLDEVNAFTARPSRPLRDESVVAFTVGERHTPCKLYWPDEAQQAPLVFYCHGGGFRHGSLRGWDAPLRQLVRESGVAVLSVGYALSPEHKFPRAFNEVMTIARTVVVDGLPDGRRITGFAMAGDSAGANLALGAAMALRDLGLNALRHLLLFYGVFSKDVERPSWLRPSGLGGHGLSREAMATYWSSYLASDESDWRVQPLHGELAGLPSVDLVIGDLDPLLDENRALLEKLRDSGVEASLAIEPRLPHGFIRLNEIAPVVNQVLSRQADTLRARFAGPLSP